MIKSCGGFISGFSTAQGGLVGDSPIRPTNSVKQDASNSEQQGSLNKETKESNWENIKSLGATINSLSCMDRIRYCFTD